MELYHEKKNGFGQIPPEGLKGGGVNRGSIGFAVMFFKIKISIFLKASLE